VAQERLTWAFKKGFMERFGLWMDAYALWVLGGCWFVMALVFGTTILDIGATFLNNLLDTEPRK
jgi:predicted metal-binding membrane protein